MTDLATAPPADPRPATPATVDRPITCVACAYNLYNLPTSGNCPECGKPVSESLKDRLELLPPGVLRSLAGGLALMLVSTVLSPGCIGMSIVGVATWDSGRTPQSLAAAVGTSATFLATLGVSVASDARLWAGPHGSLWLDDRRRRALKRWSLLAGGGLLVFAVLPWIALASNARTESLAVPAWFGFVLLTVSVPRFPLYYRSLARLADSIPRRNLRKGLAGIGRTKVVTDGVLVGSVTATLTLALNNSGLAVWPAFVALLALPLYALVWIPTVVLHVRLYLAVRHVARDAGAFPPPAAAAPAP